MVMERALLVAVITALAAGLLARALYCAALALLTGSV
jgi:hypothetical protein